MYRQFECLTQNDSATFSFVFYLFEFETNTNNEINFKIEYAHAIAQILH